MNSKGMRGPTPPPKKKNRQATGMFSAAGSGHNVARAVSNGSVMTSSSGSALSTISDYSREGPKGGNSGSSQCKLCSQVFDSTPDSIIATNIEINGEISYEKLLRIDGKFEGTIQSNGDMIIGNM